MADDCYAREELAGGLVVLTEGMSGVRSASLGVWVQSGPIHERSAELGASHLLEHMVFKGTRNRDARQIALILERLGGSLDAYTTREYTSYQAQVLDAHVGPALDVLADLVLNPLLRPEDLRLEREVVLEEIATVEDTPDDLVFERHAEALWGDHPYGNSILGTRSSVANLEASTLRHAYERGYRRPNLIVAAAGNVSHEAFVDQVRGLFEPAPDGASMPPLPEPRMRAPRELAVARESAQTHLVFGTATFGQRDPRRYALAVLSTALGGGMSSRLFQRVREELGLAYAVYSYQSFYRRAGVCGIYVGTRPETADQAAQVVREELRRVARDGLRADELDDAKGQLKGQLVLSLESTGARLHRLAGFELYGEPFRTMDELMGRIDAVTADEVVELASVYYAPDRQVVVRLGPQAE